MITDADRSKARELSHLFGGSGDLSAEQIEVFAGELAKLRAHPPVFDRRINTVVIELDVLPFGEARLLWPDVRGALIDRLQRSELAWRDSISGAPFFAKLEIFSINRPPL